MSPRNKSLIEGTVVNCEKIIPYLRICDQWQIYIDKDMM